MLAWVERLILRLPHHIVLSSHRAIEDAAEPITLKVPTTIVPDGVDTDVFIPRRSDEDLREKLSLPKEVKLVGFLFLSALSFLGLGIQPPTADWGSMVRDNATLISFGDITPLLPAAAIALLTIGVNFVVDWFLHQTSGLRDDH